MVSWIRRSEPRVEPRDATTAGRPSMRTDIAAGLRYVTAHRLLRALALSVAVGYLFSTIADSILILHLVAERGFSAATVGFAFSIGSVGVIGGALVTGRLTRLLGVGPTIVFAAIGESLAWLPLAMAPDSLLFPGLTATILVLGFCGVAWNINAVSLRQAVTPRRMQGRTNATMRFISWSTIPIGSILGGVLGGAIGLHNTIWIGAIGSLLTFVPVALSPLPRVREMPASADREPEAVVGAEPAGA
jgi:MFS family permease